MLMLISTSGLSFFALSLEYRKIILDEIYILVKNSNFTYSDLYCMPTYQRKYFLGKLVEEYERQREETQKK